MEPVYTAVEHAIAQTNASVIGFMFGVIVTIGIYYIILKNQRLDTAKYIRRLSSDKKTAVSNNLCKLIDSVHELAEDTNTKYFNSMYNDLNRLHAFVQKKWNT